MAYDSLGGRSDRNLRVLIIGNDPTLEEEFRSAVSGVPDTQAVVYFAPTHRHALEAILGRQPHLVVIEIDRDAGEAADLSKQIHGLLPTAAIAAAFNPATLEHGQAESSVIIDLLRAQVSDFLRRPLSSTELRAVLNRLFARQPDQTPPESGRIVSFVSNKGGVGKSTLAVNVACGLARRFPDDVLLVDLSLQLGTCALMLDLNPVTTILDAVRERERLDETLLRNLTVRHECGVRLLAAPANAVEAADVDDEEVARILNLARRAFGFVIVDTFPVLDNVIMTVLDLSDIAFVVAQGTAPSAAGMARFLPILEGLGFPSSRLRLVLNHNYRTFLGDLRPADVEQRLQRPLDHVVPYEARVLASMNTGSPQILHARWWQRFARAVDAIVSVVANGMPGGAVQPPAGRPNGDGSWWSAALDRRVAAPDQVDVREVTP